MERRAILIFILTLIFCLGLASAGYAETKTIVLKLGDPYMTVNGVSQEIDPGRGTKAMEVKGRTLVPIRTIVENMGGTIAWNDVLKQITITANNKTIKMTVGYNKAEIKEMNGGDNWVTQTLDVAPMSINGRTMVPLRFATENLGAALAWDGASKKITLTFAVAAVDPTNWAGTWETDMGVLSLQQVGKNVTTVSNNDQLGKLTGTSSGKVFTGKWYLAVGNQGDIILTLSDDGKVFTGKYNYNYPGTPFVGNPEYPEEGWSTVSGQRS